jgi:hypothetical protein
MINIQKIIIIIGALSIILLCLFPPWIRTFSLMGIHSEKPAGYAFIVDPPAPEKDTGAFGVRIDTSRLLIQLAIVIVATSLGVLLTTKKLWRRNTE